jgi:hypothetical protein
MIPSKIQQRPPKKMKVVTYERLMRSRAANANKTATLKKTSKNPKPIIEKLEPAVTPSVGRTVKPSVKPSVRPSTKPVVKTPEILSATKSGGSVSSRLLKDLARIVKSKTEPAVRTQELITSLCAKSENWASYNKGSNITPAQVSRLLKPYGIQSQSLWVKGVGSFKGYNCKCIRKAYKASKSEAL